MSDRLSPEGPGRDSEGSEQSPSRGSGPARVKVQSYMTAEVAERAKNAWWWSRNEPDGFETFSDLVEDAVQRAMVDLEQRHNDGRPFPARPARSSRGGRPPGR